MINAPCMHRWFLVLLYTNFFARFSFQRMSCGAEMLMDFGEVPRNSAFPKSVRSLNLFEIFLIPLAVWAQVPDKFYCVHLDFYLDFIACRVTPVTSLSCRSLSYSRERCELENNLTLCSWWLIFPEGMCHIFSIQEKIIFSYCVANPGNKLQYCRETVRPFTREPLVYSILNESRQSS